MLDEARSFPRVGLCLLPKVFAGRLMSRGEDMLKNALIALKCLDRLIRGSNDSSSLVPTE